MSRSHRRRWAVIRRRPASAPRRAPPARRSTQRSPSPASSGERVSLGPSHPTPPTASPYRRTGGGSRTRGPLRGGPSATMPRKLEERARRQRVPWEKPERTGARGGGGGGWKEWWAPRGAWRRGNFRSMWQREPPFRGKSFSICGRGLPEFSRTAVFGPISRQR